MTLRPSTFVAAAAVIGGAGVAVWPQHWVSILQVTAATAAVAAGLHALRENLPRVDRWTRPLSPLERRPARPRRPEHPPELQRTLSYLRAARYVGAGVALPWRTSEQLQQAATALFERHGFDRTVAADRAAVRAAVSPLTWAVLTDDPRQTPRHRRDTLRSNEAAVADLVHAVLDDLDRMVATRSAASPTRGVP